MGLEQKEGSMGLLRVELMAQFAQVRGQTNRICREKTGDKIDPR